MSKQTEELKKIFEYEIKRKLSDRARSKAEEFRILMNCFKFYDYNNSGKVNQIEFVKGILRTGLSGFNESDVRSYYNFYDTNNTGFIDYKNFCNYLFGKEPFNSLSNTQTETKISDNRNNNESLSQIQKTPINIQREKTPINQNINNNNDNNVSINNQYMPNEQNLNQIENERKMLFNQRKEYFKKLIISFKDQILINNGVTYYTFLNELNNLSDQNKNISLDNFMNASKKIGLNIPDNDIINFYSTLLDFIGTGKITLDDIINIIVDPMNENRKLSVVNKFSKIDVEKQGEVQLSLLKEKYNSKGHPDVVCGKTTEEEIFKQFCYTLDIYCNLRNIKENINYKQFIDYYNGISSSILNENYFEDILNGVWNDNTIEINQNINNNNNLESNIELNNNIKNIEDNKNIINFNNNNYENQNMNNGRYNNDINKIIKHNNNYNSTYTDGNIGINGIFLGEPNHVIPKSFGKINFKRSRRNFNPNNLNNNQYQNNQININPSIDIIDNNAKRINSINPTIPKTQEIETNKANLNPNEVDIQNNNDNYNTYNVRKRRPKISYNPITNEYYQINTENNMIQKTGKVTPLSQINNNIYSTDDNQNKNNINYQNNKNNLQSKEEQKDNIINNSLNKLKNKLISRGTHILFSFQRKLSYYDMNHQGLITFDNFLNIVRAYAMDISQEELKIVFEEFDKDKTGSINYNELIQTIIGPISPQRQLIIKKIFSNFPKDNNGKISINEIKMLFNSKRHPDVIYGIKREGEIFGEFLDNIESYREYLENMKGVYDNNFSLEDFTNFYNEVGVGIEDDRMFEYMMNNCWNFDKNLLNNNNMNQMGNYGSNRYKNNVGYINNYNSSNGNLMVRAGSQIMNSKIF